MWKRSFWRNGTSASRVKPESEGDGHRPVGETLALESILSHVDERQVTNDYTVSWAGQRWQIPKQAARPGLRRSSIRIKARLDGKLMARIGDACIELSVCKEPEKANVKAKRPARRYAAAPGQSRWMDRFSLKGSEKWKAYGRQVAGASDPLQSPSGLPQRA